MKKVDFIVVGMGFAGACFVHECMKHNKSVVVFDHQKSKASAVAAGVFNPVVLKRFNAIWKAEEQLNLLKETFGALENQTQEKFLHHQPIYRIFSDENEQHAWLKKRDSSPALTEFLDQSFIEDSNSDLKNDFLWGKVNHTGRVDGKQLFHALAKQLGANYLQEIFEYDLLKFTAKGVVYKDIEANYIVFAEGSGFKNNPYFDHLPIQLNKGEVLHIKTQAQLPRAIIKSKLFLVPLNEDTYYVGATYNRNPTDDMPTAQSRKEMETKLRSFLHADFQVIGHYAALRPTVPDRRSIVGTHPIYPSAAVLNGMGTRATFLAPFSARLLYNWLVFNQKLPNEINVDRFF